MIKAKATKDFLLKKFDELKIIERKNKDEKGKIYKDDIFECEEGMAKYLNGENAKKESVIEIIEIIPGYKEVKITDEIIEKPFVEKATKKEEKKSINKNLKKNK